MPTDFACAKYIISVIKEKDFKILSPDVSEEAFWKRSMERWAIDDLVGYLEENWFTDTPVELISDYIDDCQFRYGRYWDQRTGMRYHIAKETAETIMLHFI